MPNTLRLLPRIGQADQSEHVERKGPARAFTSRVEAEIIYRWKYVGQSTREISRGLRINDREAVERVIQDRMTGRGPVTPAARRVA